MKCIFSILCFLFFQQKVINQYVIDKEIFRLGGYNEVFLFVNDTLVRIDKSKNGNFSIDSYNFLMNDTIVKYGGYGYWSQRNFLYYFDIRTYEWELLPINRSENLEGSFDGFTFQNKTKTMFLGGKKVSTKNRHKIVKSNEVVEFDINDRELKSIGELEFDFTDKRLFYKNDSLMFLFEGNRLYKINPFKNSVNTYKKPPIINYNMNVEFDGSSFLIKKPDNSSEIFILPNQFNKVNSIKTELLFNQSKEFKYSFYTITFIVLISILGIIRWISFSNRRSSIMDILDKNESLILEELLNGSIKFNELLDKIYNENISYVHNTRLLNSTLISLTIKLKTKYHLKFDPIKKTKSLNDRRVKVVSFSDEIIKKLKRVEKKGRFVY